MEKEKTYRLRGFLLLTAILAILMILTWIIQELELDLRIAGRFYSESKGWFLGDKAPWVWLYRYGTIPGLLLILAALFGWYKCFLKDHLRYLHRYFLVIVLTAIIGPGVLVNGILKNYWSRPRPRQVEQFGGQWAYRHPHQPGIPGKGESFPCGHCTMGFLFCSLFVFRRQKAWAAYLGGIIGLLLGALLSAARIVQGAHFLSDTLWSFGLLLMIPIALYFFVLNVPKARVGETRPLSQTKRRWLWLSFTVCLIAITGAFLLHRPFYKEHRIEFQLPADVSDIVLQTDEAIESFDVQYRDVPPHVSLTAQGFAWIGSKHYLRKDISFQKNRMVLMLKVVKKGYFSELTQSLQVYLPEIRQNSLKAKLRRGHVED